jgi:cytochrome c peroxidase
MRAPGPFAAVVVSAITALGSPACRQASESDGYGGPPIPWEHSHFPESSPEAVAKIALGRLLFYDPILSSDRSVACATCHSEIWGLADGLPLSIGVGGEGPTGPGRTGPNVTRRNAPTLWNIAFVENLFWDGRARTLEEQIKGALADPTELGRAEAELVADLARIPEYTAQFEAAFDGDSELITGDNLARAIAAFERSIVSRRAPYDQWVRGDEGALDDETVRGMYLFAEAGCASCHAPPLFASERFVARGIGSPEDLGRFELSSDEADRGAFRVPTLRNVRHSGPYFHDGSVAELRAAVELELAHAARPFAGDEVDAITRFIDKALTDRTGEPSRPKTVPSGLTVPIDGFRVPR